MTFSKRDVFEELEPPPGGAAMLRRRLESERHRPRVLRALLPLTAAVAAATVITVWVGLGTRVERVRVVETRARPELAALVTEHPATIGLGIRPVPTEPVVVPAAARRSCAVERVATPDDEVIFYWVNPSEPPESAP